MDIYRMELEGHLLEVRRNDWGAETVLIDGRIVSNRPWAGFQGPSHFFELDGHQIEIRRRDTSRFKFGRYEMLVNVDGRERARLEGHPDSPLVELCRNCGYALEGLPVVSGEVCCPECGRHTPAVLLGRGDE